MSAKAKAKSKAKGLADFEQAHGGSKIDRLAKQLAVEQEKVRALAGTKEAVHLVPAAADNTVRFGLIGDLHIGSLYSCVENLAAFYERCAERGCSRVLVAGDILDGWRMYKGQEFELLAVGYDAQLELFAKVAPRVRGVATDFITGNHDASFKKLVGVDVGAAIQEARPDWRFIGEDYGRVEFRTAKGEPFRVDLFHLGGGTAYAISYRSQRAIEALEGGTKPHLAAFGHFHKAEFLPSYRNIVGIQTGAFQWQTPFMASKASAAHVGGWIIEAQPAAGVLCCPVRAEFIPFYRPAR